MINPWRVLGVHRQSTEDDVRTAYIELAKRLHPDVKGPAYRDTNLFPTVNEAYQILKDNKRQSIFIKDMIIRNRECTTCKGVGATYKSTSITSRTFKACSTCGGAGVIIKEREENSVIELQSTGEAGRARHTYQRSKGRKV